MRQSVILGIFGFLAGFLFKSTILGNRKVKVGNQANNQAENHEADVDVNSDGGSSGEGSESRYVQSEHKIFLSHSGRQKPFVESVCEDLENRRRFPFFDRRDSSLPDGEKFPEKILEAARQCQLAVVVVSEDYFLSKWPMIELVEFMRARSGKNPNMKILPLFFQLSASEFSERSRQERWFKEWEKWAKKDPARVNIAEWKLALKEIKLRSGIEFNGDFRKVGDYRKLVVSRICKIVPPDIKSDDSHIQGRSNLLKAYWEKIQAVQPSEKYKGQVIGFYGLGGIGKTTMCEILCNELSELEFEGKACHVELGANRSAEEVLKKVLGKLTSYSSEELIQQLSEGECKNLLRKSDSWKQKTFLAIDNVWDDLTSIEQAAMLLKAPFHRGSVVVVTSRFVKTLAALGIDGSNCHEMPELDKVDAKELFLYHALRENQSIHDEFGHGIVEACMQRCYFQKNAQEGFHYLPLALKTLGTLLRILGNKPSGWMKSLPKVRDFNHSTGENPVFDTIRLNFDRLPNWELQALFMDIARYTPRGFPLEKLDVIWWLSVVHNQRREDIGDQLQQLKEMGLLEDVDISSGKISMHDLYCEFAAMELQGKLRHTSSNSRGWIYDHDIPSCLKTMQSDIFFKNLIRVGIQLGKLPRGDDDATFWDLNGIQWRYCPNIVVLKLVALDVVKGDLDLSDLGFLRSLELQGLHELDRLQGLENLNNLTYFQWSGHYNGICPTLMGPLPGSLKVLQVVGVSLTKNVFASCIKLCKLKLQSFCADEGLDFSNCTSLQSIELWWSFTSPSLSGLAAGLSSRLQSLRIIGCGDLSDVAGLGDLVGLQRLQLFELDALEKLPDLQKLTRLEVLRMEGMRKVKEVPGLGNLRQLRELKCSGLGLSQLPNLSELEKLHRLDLSYSDKLTTLGGLGRLPALRHLNILGCGWFLRLPDLSELTNLDRLDLPCSDTLLHEEDIAMLARLPRLRWVNDERWVHALREAW